MLEGRNVTEIASLAARLGIDGTPVAVHAGVTTMVGYGEKLIARSPIDGSTLAEFNAATPPQVDEIIGRSSKAFRELRSVPAPRRGEFVRRLGNRLRDGKDALAQLVCLETGKIHAEALGEVQEMIDMCDFAVGQSRQLHGLVIASERSGHRLSEQWHPLGPVGVITAFNFPVAVWAWNAMLAIVCGDSVIWKPSEKTPLTALACHEQARLVLREMPDIPGEALALVLGGGDLGRRLAESPQLPLISATGSIRMGRIVATTVANRLGRSLLELGGNNGMIVSSSADLDLALRSILFAAAGTAGQRCTTLRRLILQSSIADRLLSRLVAVYRSIPVGDPRSEGTLVGPLIDEAAAAAMERALNAASAAGGHVLVGGERLRKGVPRGGVYVRPAIVEIDGRAAIVQEETFAPILYVHRYEAFDDAIDLHNSVPQGLSSAVFTTDLREAELFCSARGSDCGIVNVNTGTSGAEIGGAFGGEKQTGGGRESGSDAWKTYMRRATNTINYSTDLPLSQGIHFDVR